MSNCDFEIMLRQYALMFGKLFWYLISGIGIYKTLQMQCIASTQFKTDTVG